MSAAKVGTSAKVLKFNFWMKGLPKVDIPAKYGGICIKLGPLVLSANEYLVDPATKRGFIVGNYSEYTFSEDAKGFEKTHEETTPDTTEMTDDDTDEPIEWVCPNLLKTFIETEYAWNGVPELKRIFHEMIQLGVKVDEDFLTAVQTENWKAVDSMNMRTDKDKYQFWHYLQQLFYFYYFLKAISRRQYQFAFGIQQMRWMASPSHDTPHKCEATIALWEDISLEDQREIIAELVFHFLTDRTSTRSQKKISKRRMLSPDARVEFQRLLANTVWYTVVTSTETLLPFKFDLQGKYFFVPESLNFSNLFCVHVPHLVFGKMGERSLARFIFKNNRRPFPAHLPDSPLQNLTSFHGIDEAIHKNWVHDFVHTTSHQESCTYTAYDYLSSRCPDVPAITNGSFLSALDDKSSELNRCFESDPDILVKMNDGGYLFGPYEPVLGGKRRSHHAKRRSTKKRYTRKAKRVQSLK